MGYSMVIGGKTLNYTRKNNGGRNISGLVEEHVLPVCLDRKKNKIEKLNCKECNNKICLFKKMDFC